MLQLYKLELTGEQYDLLKEIFALGHEQYVNANMDSLNREMRALSNNAEDPSSYAALLQNYGDLHDEANVVLEIVQTMSNGDEWEAVE